MTRPELTFARSGGAPRQPPSIVQSAVVSVLFVGAVLALLWAVANPLLAASSVGIVATVAVSGRVAVRRTRRRLAVRRRTGRSRQVCLVGDAVCVNL